MNELVKEITISDDIANYIQRLHYEVEGYKAITVTIIQGQGEFQYNKELYDYHMAKFQEAQAMYNIAANALIEEHGSDLPNKSKLSLSMDFMSKTIQLYHIKEKEAISCCKKK